MSKYRYIATALTILAGNAFAGGSLGGGGLGKQNQILVPDLGLSGTRPIGQDIYRRTLARLSYHPEQLLKLDGEELVVKTLGLGIVDLKERVQLVPEEPK